MAVDLATGARKWEVPLGWFAPAAPPEARARGSPNLGGAIVTAAGLVFIAATLDQRLRAFDIETGAAPWSARLPAGGKATPMTFRGRSGTQYVVIAAGGDGGRFGKSDRIVAFALRQRLSQKFTLTRKMLSESAAKSASASRARAKSPMN